MRSFQRRPLRGSDRIYWRAAISFLPAPSTRSCRSRITTAAVLGGVRRLRAGHAVRFSRARISSAAACTRLSPAATMRPPPCAGPFSQVVTMPPAPAMIGISGDDVVRLELGLDDEVDLAGRQHAIGVAIAAVARELHLLLDACRMPRGRLVHQQRAGGGQQRVGERSRRRAPAGRACRPARDSARAPPSPEKRSRMNGWCIMPNTGSPNRIRPISVPQAGMPEMNDLVPSIGSSTQTYSASVCSDAVFLAEDAVVGKLLADQRAHALLRRAVGGGDRVEPAGLFVLDRQRGAEERQDRIAGRGGELIDEAAEVDGRHAAFGPSTFAWDMPEGVLSGEQLCAN